MISWSEIWGSPRGAILVWIVHPGGGRAPHARKDGVGLAGACPHLATGRSFPPDDYVVPRHAYGLAMRARRPRPSEKTTSRVISRPSPIGHLTSASPPAEGRAPHARKQRMTPTRARLLLAIGLFAHPPTIMTCPGLGPARISGRAERIPPRKPPFA